MQQQQPLLVIEQDQIGEFEDTAYAFFSRIFRKDADEVFITDLSDLSDFRFMRPPGDRPVDTDKPYAQLAAEWDAWVMGEIAEHFQLPLEHTDVNLVHLFNQIEQGKTRVLH
jgi:hypothetical protein